MRKYLIIFLYLTSHLSLVGQNVTNVQVQQKGTNIIITYHLDKEANVTLHYGIGHNTTIKPKHVYGDVGTNIRPGIKTITWEVLKEYDKFVYNNVQFLVSASQSSNAIAKDLQKTNRQQQYAWISPWKGASIFGGYLGVGVTGYIPVSKHMISLVLDFYGTSDNLHYKIVNDDNYSTIAMACNIGLNFMVHQNVGVFLAPGVGWHIYFIEDNDGYYTEENFKPCFSLHTGVGVSFGRLLLTAHIAYPTLAGVGIGVTL